jgi:mono/diheme cytochrome c family protein
MMKKFIILGCIIVFVWACGGGVRSVPDDGTASSSANAASNTQAEDAKGIGKFTQVDLPATIDKSMAAAGQKIYDLKCAACHRLDETKLVGPGWKGVMQRRKPEWVMNFVTNTDANLNKDPQAMSLLEECMVRMPDQNLSDDDARHILEFMRNNDAK